MDDGAYGLGIINEMLRRRGMREPSPEEHGRLFDFPVIRYYERLGFDFESESFETVSHEFVAAYLAGAMDCPLRAATEETLRNLRAHGFRQSVLSASRQDHLERFIAHYGLLEYFEELLGIDSVHAPGKAGRGNEWIRESALEPARVLLIGDTVHDSEVAAEMGIQCWLMEGGHHPVERLRETGRRCFSDLPSVQAALTTQTRNAATV